MRLQSVHSRLTAQAMSRRPSPWPRLATAMVLLVVAAACGGDSAGPGNPQGSLSARVDGANWSANTGVMVLRANGYVSFGGSRSSGSTTLTIAFPDQGPQTYAIPATIGLNMNYTEGTTGALWQAIGFGTALGGVGTGSVVVEVLTAERVAGTFSFTAPAAQTSAASGTKTVTNGAFDIKF